MELMGSLYILFVILICLHQCSGLECKKGYSLITSEGTAEKGIRTEQCPSFEFQYCVATICTTVGEQALSSIVWGCNLHNDKASCANYTTMRMIDKTKLKNISCHCEFGEIGVDLANEHFLLPTDRIKCVSGVFNAKGYGSTVDKNCTKEAQSCYTASCASDNDSAYMLWGCRSEAENCTAIESKEAANLKHSLRCQCVFGEKGVQLSNENVTLLIPPIFIDIEATNMDSSSPGIRLIGEINRMLLLMIGMVPFRAMFACHIFGIV
ncbi:hypothetical protein GPALN_007410 [Globodera pallida]|uniref:Activin_recp domain-containing protein n=1 Tax=Globodera pallida TaxID=36090 RepID=A0A183BJY6_GLOPA|nr:hypothetical protein GPALN_007410 [Globodera pallida]